MVAKTFRNVLRKLKYIILSDEKQLSRLEILLRWLIEGSALSIVFLFLYVGSNFFGLSNPAGLLIVLILVFSYIKTLEYFRKKAKQEKTPPR